jgi:hypothetical protein
MLREIFAPRGIAGAESQGSPLRAARAVLGGLLTGSRWGFLYWAVVVAALGLFVNGALEHAERVNDDSAKDVRRRFEKGFRELYRKSVSSHGFYRYAVIALVAAAIALANRKLRSWLSRNSRFAWFTSLYVIGYLVACSWFHAINGGVRFVVSLVGPLIFVGAWLSDRAPRPVRGTASLWTIACAAALAADIPAALWVYVRTMKSSGW